MLFARDGFGRVTVKDIAAEVGVGPSALYRHFSGKTEILSEVLSGILDDYDTVLAESGPGEDLLHRVATFFLDHRHFGVLWQSESRHLPQQSYDVARVRLRGQRMKFSALLAEEDAGAGMGAVASLAILLGPSWSRVELPRPDFEEQLVALSRRVLAVPLPATADVSVTPAAGRSRTSQRERLVASASRLFASRTYTSVSVEELAAQAGLAASSLYSHLPAKLDLLGIALTRADGLLQLTLDRILATTPAAADALRKLVVSYADFAVARPELVDGLMTAIKHLPEQQADWLLHAQRSYVDEWIHLLREVHPGQSSASARLAVVGALMIANDLSRTPAIRHRSDATEAISALMAAALLI